MDALTVWRSSYRRIIGIDGENVRLWDFLSLFRPKEPLMLHMEPLGLQLGKGNRLLHILQLYSFLLELLIRPLVKV